ncbi:hypothetical protein HYV43_02860 [Candidatus Micrarchaeota archaeon]|nr:hypothetical protein [Candidatus Micrarchaeota archaeon]
MSLNALLSTASKRGIRITSHSGVYELADFRGRKPIRLDVHFEMPGHGTLDEELSSKKALHRLIRQALPPGVNLKTVGFTRIDDETPWLHSLHLHASPAARKDLEAIAVAVDAVKTSRTRREPRI